MVAEKISALRLKYENERAAVDKEYKKTSDELNSQLSLAKAFDYSKAYRDKYSAFCSAMEGYYQKIVKTESDIHGLEFYSDKYMPKAVAMPFGGKNVEEMFELIVEKCANNVKELEAAHKVNEYASLSRSYCDLLATMRYIVKNSADLLIKSGHPAADKKREVDKIQKKIDGVNETYRKRSKLENFTCYNSIVALKDELDGIYERARTELLGAVSLGDDGQYRYLVGYRIEKISDIDAKFCEQIVGVGRERIGREPVYLCPATDSSKTNLIINAPNAFLSSKDCYELIRNLYFSVASRVDKNMLQFGCIECTERRGIARGIYTAIDSSAAKKLLGGDGVYCYNGINTNETSKVSSCLTKINRDCNESIDNYDNLVEYNRKTEKNKQPIKLVSVNLYPSGFVDATRSENSYSKLQQIMEEYWDSGTFFIVCQDTSNPDLAKEGVRINPSECNAIEITLSEANYNSWKNSGKPIGNCEFTYNGSPMVFDIAVPNFDGENYWEELKQFYSTKKIFALRDIFRKTDIATNNWKNPPSVFDDGAIEIPLGLKGSDEYSLRYPLSMASHTLVYGGSGSGKSSFLHTLILSLCYKYSSEDVQIYLADFKGSEFNFYVENKLPHIKYFLLKNGITEVRDTFNMIEHIRIERNELIRRYGCKDIVEYNKKAKNNDNMEKLPMLFFIIDEYQVIAEVTGADSRDMDDINGKISTIFSQARSAGIALFLCGQELSDITSFNITNIPTCILLGKQIGNDMYIRKYFLGDDYNNDVEAAKDFLSMEQEGRCLIKSAQNKIADKIRAAFPGRDAEKRAEYVRNILSLQRPENKKRLSIILGGSEDPVNVVEDADYSKEMMRDSATSFNLGVGIGSTIGLPSYVNYASEDKNYGWLVYSTKSDRIFNITRNVILSFLFKTAYLGYNYNYECMAQRVQYWGDMYSYKNVIGSDFFGRGYEDLHFVLSFPKLSAAE